MDNNSTSSLCVICCVSYMQDDRPPYHDDPNFHLFCRQLEKATTTSSCSLPNNKGNAIFSTSDLLITLQDNFMLISVCSDCAHCLTLAANTRADADLLESCVISLQMQVVKALRDLKSKTDVHLEQLNCVRERIEWTDGSCVDACFKGKENGQPGKMSKKAKEKSKNNPVALFRDAILNWTSDFKQYTQELNRKLVIDRPTKVSAGLLRVRPRRSKTNQIIETDKLDPNDMGALKSHVSNTEVGDQGHGQNTDEDEEGFHFDHNDNSDPEYVPIADHDDDYANNCSDSDRSLSPLLEPVQNTNKFPKMKIKDFNKYSPFRKRLVKRIMNRKHYQGRNGKGATDSDPSNPLQLKRTYLMEYNESNGAASIGGIEVTINDQLKTLECSICEHQAKPQGQSNKREEYMDRSMWDHIVGKHLRALRCLQCSKVYSGFKNFQEHLKVHKEHLKCNVCSKPVGSQRTLVEHEWTHLSEEEKVERERTKGIKRPQQRGKVGEFICSTCGKCFKRWHDLVNHNQTHLPKQDRDKVQCPQCGTLVLKNNSHKHICSHKRVVAKPSKNIPCNICGKILISSQKKREHMVRVHSEAAATRPFNCTICQKGFKTKACVTTHMEIHNPDDSFVCSKGCGKGFRRKRHCVKHEKNCSGAY